MGPRTEAGFKGIDAGIIGVCVGVRVDTVVLMVAVVVDIVLLVVLVVVPVMVVITVGPTVDDDEKGGAAVVTADVSGPHSGGLIVGDGAGVFEVAEDVVAAAVCNADSGGLIGTTSHETLENKTTRLRKKIIRQPEMSNPPRLFLFFNCSSPWPSGSVFCRYCNLPMPSR